MFGSSRYTVSKISGVVERTSGGLCRRIDDNRKLVELLRGDGSMPPVAYLLMSLWCAEPAQAGCWRLEDGAVLSLQPGDNIDAAAAMRSGFLAA